MYLLHVPVEEYWKRWHEFDAVARALQLTPADRHFAWTEHTSDEHWREWPVPMYHFLQDPYYVGTKILIRPAVGQFMMDFDDPAAGHELFVFIGGIGAGKSFSASVLLMRTLYVLSCLREPQRYINGFPGVSLSGDAEIALMNASAAGANQASKIVYGELYEKIEASPYFRMNFQPYPGKSSELEFPNRIRMTPGTSQWKSALGYNMFAFAVDEAALGMETDRADYVKELFQAFNQRRRSRFGRLGWGGLFTSPGSEYGFVEQVAGEGEDWDTSILVRRITTWEAKGELVPGARIFLLDRHPDSIRILEKDLIFRGYDEEGMPIAQRANGEVVRIRNLDPLPKSPADYDAAAAAA